MTTLKISLIFAFRKINNKDDEKKYSFEYTPRFH